jgi:hypothetical protein
MPYLISGCGKAWRSITVSLRLVFDESVCHLAEEKGGTYPQLQMRLWLQRPLQADWPCRGH